MIKFICINDKLIDETYGDGNLKGIITIGEIYEGNYIGYGKTLLRIINTKTNSPIFFSYLFKPLSEYITDIIKEILD